MNYALIKSNKVENVIVADGPGIAALLRDAFGCDLYRDVTGQSVAPGDTYNPANQTFSRP